jgi:hypothetical protein
VAVKLAALLVLALAAGTARAQPAPAAAALQQANAAATAGDWPRVAALVDPLLGAQLGRADLAEAHRLAGLASYFDHRTHDAEAHFLAYLRLDPDARLDPALVPPEAVTFFEDVRARHAAELRAVRPRSEAKPSFVLELVPPFGQFQNHEPVKGWIIGGALGAFAIANVATYAVLRDWCSSSDDTCGGHTHGASTLRGVNLAAGIAFIATYAYGVYDGVVGYRRGSRERALAPYATAQGVVGVFGFF